ncbi:MAG: hypothetical protein ACW964_11785, partial [Candidatus Hodarchaeales archaeon]
EEINHISIAKKRIIKKYDAREKRLLSVLDEIGGKYMRVDSIEQNLLLMLKQEFELEETEFNLNLVKK